MNSLEQLAFDVGQAVKDGPSEERRKALRQKLIEHRRSTSNMKGAYAFLLCSALALGIWLISGFSSTPIARLSGGSVLSAGAFIESDEKQVQRVEFDDKSQLVFEERARARLTHLETDGVSLHLDTGVLQASITPKSGRKWSVAAGPYEVQVVGTVFKVDWQPGQRSLFVGVTRGAVRVVGPHLGAGVSVEAGQRLSASVGSQQALLEPLEGAQAVDQAATNQAQDSVEDAKQQAPQAKPVEPSREAAPASSTRPQAPTWKSLAEAGEHREAMLRAEEQGFDGLLGRLGPADLKQLADTARFAGQSERAAAALTALRNRFAQTEQAKLAAFLLGRMAFDSGNANQAVRWFSTYLGESPTGAMAADALGRQMTAYERANNRGQAALSAERYLKAYPDGPYAKAARALTRGGRLR